MTLEAMRRAETGKGMSWMIHDPHHGACVETDVKYSTTITGPLKREIKKASLRRTIASASRTKQVSKSTEEGRGMTFMASSGVEQCALDIRA